MPANVARNLSWSFFEIPEKRCNSNDANSMFEQVAGELRAKLMGDGGAWSGFEAKHKHTSAHQVPLVWRGPEGTGGLRDRALRAKLACGDLAGGRARRHPEHPWGHTHHHAAPHANRWGASRHPTRQRPSFNKRSLCRQRLGGADLGGPAAGQPRRDQRGHDGHDAHADQL